MKVELCEEKNPSDIFIHSTLKFHMNHCVGEEGHLNLNVHHEEKGFNSLDFYIHSNCHVIAIYSTYEALGKYSLPTGHHFPDKPIFFEDSTAVIWKLSKKFLITFEEAYALMLELNTKGKLDYHNDQFTSMPEDFVNCHNPEQLHQSYEEEKSEPGRELIKANRSNQMNPRANHSR